MKKKIILCGALAVVAGLSLASCGETPSVSQPTTSESKKEREWTTGSNLDIYINYNKGASGITYAQTKEYTNPIDAKTYKTGNMLPVWSEFQTRVSNIVGKQVTFRESTTYAKKDDNAVYEGVIENNFKSEINTNETIDLFYNKTDNIVKMGSSNKCLNLRDYLDKMPNFKKYLEENPAIEEEISYGKNKAIYYTPYLDGYNQIERQFVMDTAIVSTLLDNPVGDGLGNLVSGGANANAKTVKKVAYTPFIDAEHNYPTANQKIKIVKNNAVAEITVNQTTNIIKQQNELLNAGTTGKALIDQFKTYLDTAYGVGEGKNYAKYADIFTSVSACYNADDLIALMRVVKANPDVLFGTATEATADDGEGWREVETLFHRGENTNRVNTMINFASTVWGVQGIGAEKDHLFFGADGKLYDAETIQATYDMLDNLSALYQEGLILDNFWYKGEKTDGDKYKKLYFAKTSTNSSYGLLEYDYSATQSSVNTYVDGLGTKNDSRAGVFKNTDVKGIMPILGPVTYWGTEKGLNPTAKLGSAEDRSYKTLTRYYEENRAVKNTSWCIPTSSDNIEAALALMDDMFSTDGANLQNFGPQAYWQNGTVLGEEGPVIKETVFAGFSGDPDRTDIWNYYRQVIGSTEGIGHVRQTSLDYQSTNEYSKPGYDNLILACKLGVQGLSSCKPEYTWNTTVRTNCYPVLGNQVTDKYKAVTQFWAIADKLAATTNGWVTVVANPSGTAMTGTVVDDGTNKFDLVAVKSKFDEKNKNYLYEYAYSVGKDCVPTYIAKK